MARPTYEELEQKVKELEEAAIEHKRVDALLHEKEEYFRSLFHTMSEGVVLISSNGQILQANPASEHILGLSRSGIKGHSYVGPEWQILRPDGTAMPPEEMAGPRAMRTRHPVHDMVMGVKRPDGVIAWISVNATPIIEEGGTLKRIVATFIDITERKQVEEVLKASEEKYRTALEANPDPVVVYDMEGKVIYFNPAFTRVFGWSPEERIGKKMDDFVPEENWPETKKMIDKVTVSGESFSGLETCRYTKNGEILPISISGSFYRDQEGNITASVINLRDSSEQKKLEAQLQKVQKMKAIATLAGGIAHEFNNALTTSLLEIFNCLRWPYPTTRL